MKYFQQGRGSTDQIYVNIIFYNQYVPLLYKTTFYPKLSFECN